MADALHLSLPERPPPRPANPTPWLALLTLLALLLLASANLLVLWRAQGPAVPPAATPGGLAPTALRDLALKLEQQGLRERAIAAWQEALAGLPAAEQSKLWFRIGTLEQERRDYDGALAAYYRSEALAKQPDLESELNRRVQECLEATGRHAALDHELASRVGVNETKAAADVVAEIGPRQITRAELDRRLDEYLAQQLDAQGYLTDEQRQQRQLALHQRFNSDEQKANLLNAMVLEEILYRKAREDRLTDDAKIRGLLDDVTRRVLASQVMERELAAQVKIGDSDLETWYQAHQREYLEPEKARLSQIVVTDEASAAAALKSLDEKQTFEAVAKRVSTDAATKDKGGELDGWVSPGAYVPGVGKQEELNRAIFATEAGKVIAQPFRTGDDWRVIKVRERQPARQKTFDEVRGEVGQAVHARKQQEAQDALLKRLRERYDVVIHLGKTASETPAKAPAPKPPPPAAAPKPLPAPAPAPAPAPGRI